MEIVWIIILIAIIYMAIRNPRMASLMFIFGAVLTCVQLCALAGPVGLAIGLIVAGCVAVRVLG